jgi:hypothetical protein
MDALHFKVDQLKTLWQEYRIANEYSGKDYSDHGEWAREKLQVSKQDCCLPSSTLYLFSLKRFY